MKKKVEMKLIKLENDLLRFEETHRHAYIKSDWMILNAQRQVVAEILLMFPPERVKKDKI